MSPEVKGSAVHFFWTRQHKAGVEIQFFTPDNRTVKFTAVSGSFIKSLNKLKNKTHSRSYREEINSAIKNYLLKGGQQ